MFNVNALNKTLSAMSLPQLQSYAAMHKNDPYVVAMALSIANTKKEAMTAQQGIAGQQQMPKVVDQDIAQMTPQALPEEQGIGQLPAQNMQGMAGGGIVAFAGGGQTDSGYFDPNTGEFIINEPQDTRSFGDKFASAIGWKKGLDIDPYGGIRKPSAPAAAPAAPAAPIKGGAEPLRMTTETDPRVAAMQAGLGSVQKAAPEGALPSAAMTGAPAGLAGLTGGKSALFKKEAEPTKEDYNKEYDALYKSLDEKNAKFLEDQKSKLKTDREEALYMSMIKGGLAAAAGTSPHALQNIASGFGQGADDFNSALKDFRKAAQENAKLELEMARAQADRRAGRMDKYDARIDKIKDRQLEADKAILAANTTLQHAGITAGATLKAAQLPPKEAQMAALLGEGKTFEERFQSGLPKLTAIQAGKFDPRKAYTDYLVAAQRSGTGEIMSYPEFAMQFAPRVSGGGSGNVLPRKD